MKKIFEMLGEEQSRKIADSCIEKMQRGWIYESEKEEGSNCNQVIFIRADEDTVYVTPIWMESKLI